MKRIIVFLAVLSLSFSQVLFSQNYDFSATAPSGQTLYYKILGDNAQVTSQNTDYPYYSSYLSGALTIPDSVTYQGTAYAVTSIGDDAFCRCDSLTTIIIPNGVTSIGNYAFYNCNSLTSITIPDGVTSIGNYAFYNCNSLTSITIPNRVTSIGSRVFSYCRDLTSITIGSSVTEIGWEAFCGCTGLTSVTFPDSVTSIGGYAFSSCSGLTAVTIGSSVISIGSCAFSGCSSLNSIIVVNGNTAYDSRENCNAIIESSSNTLVVGCMNTIIPASVTSIGSNAFNGCNGLTSITIPDGVTTIGYDAFSYCRGLTSITIPSSVTLIGNYAFYNCSGLTSVTFGSGVTSIGSNAFGGCSSLTSVTIPDGVTTIGYNAFKDIRHIEYHGSATGSPWGALSMNGVTDGDFVFSDGTKHYLLAYLGAGGDVTIPSTVDTIGSNAFRESIGLSSVTIPNGVISIGNSAFLNCTGLTSVTIPNTVISIGNTAFFDCNNLSSVTIGNGVTSIGDRAFYDCSSLTSITIPDGVTTIGDRAFSYCSGLTSVTIPNSVTSIGTSAFLGCSGLTSVVFNADSCIINSSPFFGCNSIVSFTFSNNVRVIPDYICSWLSSLTSVTIPDGITSIGIGAFEYCSGLTSITINNSVTSIGSFAFSGCSSLNSAIIGSSVTSIGIGVFSGCSGLTMIRMKPIIPPVVDYASGICDSIIDLVVPHGSYAAYTNAGTNYTRHSIYSDTVFVTVNINDITRGQVIEHDSYYPYPLFLDSITLTAIPNYGYHFARWEDNTTDSIRFLLDVIHDTVLAAYFDYNQYTIMLSVDTSIHGTVSGAGSYNYSSVCTIMANANYGYHFTHWSDGDTNNPRIVTLTQDTSFTAFFDRNQYSITALSSDTLKGSAYGSDSAYYLDTITVIAVANYGYTFYRWEGIYLQGGHPQHIGFFYRDTLNIALIGEIVLNAIFLPDTFNLILSVDTSIHGSVGGAGLYYYLSERTINATANYGYHFTHWSDGDTNNPRTLILTQDTHLVAYYDKNIYTLMFQSDNTDLGIVNTASVSGEYLDSTMLIYTTPIPHYHFTQWSDGNTENPRKFVFDDNRTYTASFAIDVHTVSVQVDNLAHGSVSGAGSREYGQPITVAATPYSGYQFTHWSDGSTYNPYTFAVLEDKTLTAIFVADGEPWQDTVVLYDTTYMVLHDTTYVNVHDTSYVYVHDTTEIVMVDTMIVNHYIYDTGTVVIIDTFVVDHYIYDTVTLHDTSYVDVPVHDTTEIVVVDTVIVNHYIYDTGTVVIIDTFIVSHYIHDTTTVTVWDTVTQNIYVHDTTILNNYIHDTMYVDIYIHDTVPQVVYDTVIQTVFDTVTNTEYVFDTVTNTVYDTVINTEYLFDTVTVTDSMWVYDTLWLYDTIVIHDTIYIPQEGIGDVEGSPVKVYQSQGQIVVEGADGQPVALYDVSGRLLATRRSEEVQGGTPLRFSIRASGTYLIKVGNAPAKKVVVLR